MTLTYLARRRYRPYVGRTVTVRWNSGNDNHPDEHIFVGKVVDAGAERLWVLAYEQPGKPEQDVFVPYDQITHIEETS